MTATEVDMLKHFNFLLLILSLTLQNVTAQSLTNDLSANINTLALNTNASWSYNPYLPNLGTNTKVWTWPVNLSCVGIAASGFQAVLITKNEILSCAHFGGDTGQSIAFYDTNGVEWTAWVSNVVNPIGDMDIAQLSNSAPDTIVIPYVLPPNVTNYLPSHSVAGLPAFWLHKNASQIEYAPIDVYDEEGQEFVYVQHNGYGPFGNGSYATSGDSGSPAFMIWNNSPVLLFATTWPGDAGGLFVSGPNNWAAILNSVGTNGFNVLNLSGYQCFCDTNQIPPPPTNLRIIAP